MSLKAHLIHHTHWDPLWYFSKEDALVQFNHNFKEILCAFDSEKLRYFFLDGQSYVIEQYLKYHPEDKPQIKRLVETDKLFIGPFYNQIDAFITSGESIMRNLKKGFNIAQPLGGASRIAYLPDSFGHTVDFPKIFQQFNIQDFIITRGVGDAYELDNEFYLQSDDGSKVLTAVMLSGYGYGTYPFKDGTLLSHQAKDYNKLDVHDLITRLLKRSSLKDEFVFPLGFDQNPAILNIDAKIRAYNQKGPYTFEETTWAAYLKRIRQQAPKLKTHQGELYSTQYHRIHRTLFSARSDIKHIQDQTERILTYEVAPLRSMLSVFGINPETRLLDQAWKMLHEGQTHASATVTDSVNAAIKSRSLNAYHLAQALKYHGMKALARSLEKSTTTHPLVLFSTHPYPHTKHYHLTLYTQKPSFNITHKNKAQPYTLLSSRYVDGNVKAKHLNKDPNKYHYVHQVVLPWTQKGMGYETLMVEEGQTKRVDMPKSTQHQIDNQFYTIIFDDGLHITDKTTGVTYKKALYLEDTGDQGDNYDFDQPKGDITITDDFETAKVSEAFVSKTINRLTFKGTMLVPKNLEERFQKKASAKLTYTISLETDNLKNTLTLKGMVDNTASNHRLRLVFSGDRSNTHSEAGTQYATIKRPTKDPNIKMWRKKGFFEAPMPYYPLLNFVSIALKDKTLTTYTRSLKEYEVSGENTQDLALTLFRSVGHLGRPDLNIRPGRPSGLDNKIIATPDSQLLGQRHFDVVFSLDDHPSNNQRHQTYTEIATSSLYHQHQDFDRTAPTINYFPMNPLSPRPPKAYQHVCIDPFPVVFGTLYTNDQTSEVLRLFNADKTEYSIDLTPFKTIVNGLDEAIHPLTSPHTIQAGNLINIQRQILKQKQ